jgi:superfamily II DNA or RNA helicase
MESIKYKNWNAFFKAASLSKNHDKGLQFELLTVQVLKSHPVYASKIEKVWLLREGVPSELKKKLNIPNSDEGIDIIAQTYAGEYWAIQCKFKSSKEPPTMRELSTFNNLAHTHCKNISLAILFHTGERGVRKKHLMGEKYAEVGLEFWLSLSSEQWKNIIETSNTKKTKPTLRKPRDHQKKAIKNAQDHFLKGKASRGRLIMPCGTGKSLTAFWIANGLKAKSIIVAVPSLNLIKQSLEDWTAEFIAQSENPKPDWQVICSDETTSKLEDEFVNDEYSLGIPTTTDVEEIASFLNRKTNSRKIIFTTYQSSERLAQAARKAKFSFDLAILDEAHKTVGVKSKSFATLLSDKNIVVKKRMFMTATERVLKGTNDDVLSMDDESVYGKRFYQLTFKDAIHSSPQIISDYKILTIAVTNTQIQEIIQKNKLLSDKKNKLEEQDAQSLAAAIALRQATKKYGIKHAISFHKSIKAAESFTNLNIRLNKSKFDKIDLTSYHISSKKSAGQRSQLLDDFKADELALMTNARCLTEGVNVPTIDCVLFADPKQSIVDIVQAAGRALRVSPGKKYGYIMLPLIVPDNMEFEEFTETTPFKQVARIVAALSTQDERIVEEFRLKDEGKRTSDRRVEVSGKIPVGLKLDISSFASSIEAKYWEKVGRANWRPFPDAHLFVKNLKFNSTADWRRYINSSDKPPDIPSTPNYIYKNTGWKSWGDWLGNERIATNLREYLDFESARKIIQSLNLKSIKFWKEYCNSGKKPLTIPSLPDKVYKNKGWISWGNWLGTNQIASFQREYRSFDKARLFVRALKIQSVDEWRMFCKSENLPLDIPKSPEHVYKNKGWVNYNDWLGKKNYQSFEDAKIFARKLKLTSAKEWSNYIKHNKIPEDIPISPNSVYSKLGWKGWGDWLGSGYVANQNRDYRKYQSAKTFIQKLGLKSVAEWKDYCRSGNKPSDIPNNPDQYYKNKGWRSFGDWLGTGTVAPHKISFRSFLEARKFVHTLKLKSNAEWRQYSKSHKRPKDIPGNPARVYKNEGWKGFGDWLGNGTISNQNKVFLNYPDAKKYVHKLKLLTQKDWNEYCRKNTKPTNIPRSPAGVYKNKGWVSWQDFLGKK